MNNRILLLICTMAPWLSGAQHAMAGSGRIGGGTDTVAAMVQYGDDKLLMGGEALSGKALKHALHQRRQPEWIATIPPDRLRYATRSSPAPRIIAASASWSGNMRMLSAR